MPPDGPCRANDSAQSNGSGESDHQSQRSVPPYARLVLLLRRIQTLESKVGSLQVTLPESFGIVRGEFNEVWAKLSNLHQSTPPPDPGSSSSPAYFQEWHQNSTSGGGASTLSPASFRHLMRQVIDELCSSGCVFRTDPDAQTTGGVQSDTINQIVEQVSALSRWVGSLERTFSDPDGTIGKLESRIKTLKERCAGETIERGGWLFRDVVSVNTWVQTFKDKGPFCYCVDMVTLIMLCAEPYETLLLRVWPMPQQRIKPNSTISRKLAFCCHMD